jgi:F0F1-type ATP synthase epsilon subunit
MDCKIVSLKESREYQKIEKIVLPSMNGEIEILPNHAEIFGLLKNGKIILKNKEKRIVIEVERGMYHFKNNKLVVLF